MKKILLICIIFLAANPATFAKSSDQDISGTWKGKVIIGNGNINYRLTMKIEKKDNRYLVEAETEYGKLEIPHFRVHDSGKLIAEMFEHTQGHYFHFILEGTVLSESRIEGKATHSIDDSPLLTDTGTFKLLRQNPDR